MRAAIYSAFAALAASAVGVQGHGTQVRDVQGGAVSETTMTTIPYLTISVPKPTATIDCWDPVKDDYKNYTSLNGKFYRLDCQVDYSGNDIAQVFAPTYAYCVEACSVDPGCLAFSYIFAYDGANCFLKNPPSEPTGQSLPGVWSGKLEPVKAWDTTSSAAATAAPTPPPTPATSAPGPKKSTDTGPWEVSCYNSGYKAARRPLVAAIKFFCKGGFDGKFGGFVNNNILTNNGSLDSGIVGLSIRQDVNLITRLFVRVLNPDCQVDFAAMGSQACENLFRGPLDRCDTLVEDGKRGGYTEDNCSQWSLDPQYVVYDVPDCTYDPNADTPDPKCVAWHPDEEFWSSDT
ncbi:hypothetical protein B0H67DRAFT_611933 [Lasiosphaeris hirsuta]|uniref:Apple domain-containing protein n=1 Tax=Lasiosphaeris hirsuta TaxID=260670 RepID=A0AA40DSS6_9PEZI|nr:hypothetical protein B0H67DRAFT_611933 [Lasiosphaeris hirsuta]